MGFGGSGSSVTRAHTHDSGVINDGGSLNLDGVTQGGTAMTTGAITFSDGAAGNMQVLTLGNATDTLSVNAGATAPEWVASAEPHGAGMVVCWAGTFANIPTGWLLCNGASVATATYPDLFTALGYVYGGAGANFTLPDLVDRFVRGQSSQTAATGGADNLTLSEAQMPAHTHLITITDSGHTHQIPSSNGGGSRRLQPSGSSGNFVNTGSSTTGITAANTTTGASSSFDNRPAFIELQYIIKT
jgi:microcystin-dependent protein